MKYALKINHPLAFIFKTILKYPKQILFCCILFFFISLFYAIKLPIDASSESLILENDKDFKIYEEILQDYQTKDFLILAFIPKDGNVFSNHSLQILQKITQDIKKIPQVQDTLSILNAPLLKSTPNLELQEILKINPTLLSKQTDKNLAKNEILNHPFYTQNIISKNAKTAGILIYLKEDIKLKELTQLKNTANTQEEKQNIQNLIHTHKQNSQIHNAQTIQALKSLKEQYITEGKVYLGGIMLIASDMIDYVKSDLITYGTALSIILALMLWIFFRHIYFVALSFCVCLFSLVVSSGIFSFFGYQITIVSSNYVSLLLIISVSLIVHLIVSYLEFYEKFPKASQKNLVYAVMLNKASPSFFAVLTTIIGFLSLVFSKILPIIHLGIIMSIGVSVALIFTFILFGAILVILPKPQKVKDLPKWHHIFLLKCANLATNKPKLIYAISFLCIVFSIYGIMNLKVENSFVNYFKDNSEIKQGLLTIDQDLGGTIPLEIIINFQDKSSKDSSLSDFENEFVQQITLRESCDPRFESSFPKVRHQLISVDDEQQERSRLARKMEHAGKKRFGWRERLLLIPRYALMIAAFVAGATLIQFLLMRLDASMLADIDPFVLAFLDHTSVTSLFVLLQLPALFAASMLCDGLYHRGTLFIAFASVCFASLFSLFSNSAVFSSSLSALIFGLWSAGVIDVWMAHAYRHPLIRRQFYRQLFWMVIAALVPGNEWMSVFGGVLGALLAAMCIGKSAFHSKMRTHAMAAFATLIVAVAVWMAIDGSQIYQEHASLEASYQIADVHAK